MNRELLSKAIGEIDDGYIAEAYRPDAGDASASSERIVHMKKKRIITFALAAVLMLTLGITAYAAYSAVGTPQAAEKVAREQIEVWKDMGLLSESVHFEGEASAIVEIREQQGGDYWYGRLFPHSYDVRWYCGRTGEPKYGCNLRVDTLTGKLLYANIDAVADANALPVWQENVDPEDYPEGVWKFYDNYEDIFPADMTVDRFCTLLAEYWGFSGYTLAETVDSFYHTHYEPLDGGTLLKDINGDTRENYYLTVFFEGDQEGAPMYIQLHQYPGYVALSLGTNHGVG